MKKIIACILLFFPLVSQASVEIPRSEEEAFARFLYYRAVEEDISPLRLVTVSLCESGLKASTPPNGNKNGSTDKGLMRINSIHAPTMAKMGLKWGYYPDDVVYAIYLIKTNGWRDYRYSAHCWTKPSMIAEAQKYMPRLTLALGGS